MHEEGELAPHTPFATKRRVEWYTDEYGYRNRDTKCDVLLLGDWGMAALDVQARSDLLVLRDRDFGGDFLGLFCGSVLLLR